jgi:hypothetical protein
MLKTFTTSDELVQVLKALMRLPSLAKFRLVGDTALSLLQGHRRSEDIDLFTFQDYGTVDFRRIENDIKFIFPYFVDDDHIPGLPKLKNNVRLHLHIGFNAETAIKTDIFNWTVADFIFPAQEIDGIRLAPMEEIALMKLDSISRGGRKKDFWDMSEILGHCSLSLLLESYSVKYPYQNIYDVITGMTNFTLAGNTPDPVCLKGKSWEGIKEEMHAVVRNLRL